jgi:hypothetical protein
VAPAPVDESACRGQQHECRRQAMPTRHTEEVAELIDRPHRQLRAGFPDPLEAARIEPAWTALQAVT